MSKTIRYIIDPTTEQRIIKYYADRKHLIEQIYDLNNSRNMRRALQHTLTILDNEHYHNCKYDPEVGVTYLREYLSKRDEILRNILYKRSPTPEPLSIEALEQYWNEKIHTLDYEYNANIEYYTRT